MASQPFITSNTLVIKVLSKLGVLAVGQAVAPEDFEKVSVQLDDIFRNLAALEIVYVADADNIPAEWVSPLVAIIAGEVAVDFGGDVPTLKAMGIGGPPSQVPFMAGAAVLNLKVQLRGRPTGEAQRTESY